MMKTKKKEPYRREMQGKANQSDQIYNNAKMPKDRWAESI